TRRRTPSSSGRAQHSPRRRSTCAAACTCHWSARRRSCATARRRPALVSSLSTAAFGCTSTAPPTASRRVRRPSCTTTRRSSGPGRSSLPKPLRGFLRLNRRANDGRRDHADHPARRAVPRGRAPRARRRRRAAQPHLRAHRRPRDRARRRARAGVRRRRGDRSAAADGWRDRHARRPVRCRPAARRARARLGGRRHPAPGPRHGRRWVRARRRGLARADEGRRARGAARLMQQSDKALLRRYHEEGDLAAREQLIEQYMSLVRSLARRYSYRGEQLDDLVQIGAIGLIKAIDRFDVNRGVELTTYATPNIIGEIKRHFRDRGWSVRVPRGLQELNVKLSKLVEQLTVQFGRSPTISELAKAAGVDEEDVLEALESGRAYSSLSLSTGGGTEDGEELDPLESLGEIEHQYEVSEDRAVLAPGFRVLDDRERTILHLRFFEGLTQSQIAQQVGISQMHVSRLIRRALEKIRDEINAGGVADPDRAA